MRPIYFVLLVIGAIPAPVNAQNPVAMALQISGWPGSDQAVKGIGWSVFTKQYYGISNWNATGLSVGYSAGTGQTAAVLCRDGIPGFAWYHLYISHFRQFGKISGMLQLRFSWIDLQDRPTIFRLGGNIHATWTLSETLNLQVRLYDFTGWIFPAAAVARGDPAMEFLLLHEPGRLIGLGGGFRLSPSHFGPVGASIRVNVNDQVGLAGLMEVLPFGVSVGMYWRMYGFNCRGWLGHTGGMGLTPILEIARQGQGN